ncbi:MAG: quinone oxidoreductase [Limnobacter sp.]|nr:quinone oxidoreductase [Limnobacter sp.]
MSDQTIEAMRFHTTGGPEVLQVDTLPLSAPGPGEVQVKHHAVGLNFIEIYLRTGLYPAPLPACPGTEAAGEVIAVGDGVTEFKLGDRVAYASGPIGSYCTARNIPAQHLVPLPDAISYDQAACMMLKGLTAQYLLRRVYPVGPGDTILFHAAAGGVGTLATQWAKALGARVIGTVSTEEKAVLAKQNGCDDVIVTTQCTNLPEQVKALNGGKGLPVVYDSIGKLTFTDSLDCLRPRGLMVSFGNASGPVDPVPLTMLAQRGALMLTRPTLAAFTADRQELLESAEELFEMVMSGKVKIPITQKYALKDAAQAQEALAARKTTGCTVLHP